jgi:hypothetical protein
MGRKRVYEKAVTCRRHIIDCRKLSAGPSTSASQELFTGNFQLAVLPGGVFISALLGLGAGKQSQIGFSVAVLVHGQNEVISATVL